MEFWITSIVLAGLVAATLALAALRARRADETQKDMAVYRDQLRDLERDVARGVISAEEAERVRVEISRRLLAADTAAKGRDSSETASRAPLWMALGLAVVVLFGGYFMYNRLGAPNYPDLPLSARLAASEQARATRPSQAEVEATLDPVVIDPNVDPRLLELMDRLRTALKERPDDLQGYLLLVRNEAALGNFPAAHRAQARILAIKGDEATARDWSDYADLLVLAAGGYVSPEAEMALQRALALDPRNGTARYYVGLMFAQGDRADRAFAVWRDLLETSPPDAPWVAPIRAQIELLAADAGIRYTLPPAPGTDPGTGPATGPFAGGATAPGPTADDVAAASEMTDEERQDMIRTMVDGLAERLATEGGTPQEWARLVGALGVLGDRDRAAAIWAEAQSVFADKPDALATIRAAARQAGVDP